jgi:nucleotide-binding universal stress UspA family protein
MLGLRHALELAKGQRARVRILNVLDDRVDVPLIHGGVKTLLQAARAGGRQALEDAIAAAQDAEVNADTAMVASGGRHVSDAILDHAASWRADLIVMGTHGRRGLNRLLLGSDAERVLRKTPVPLLLLRADSAATGKR